MENSFLSYYYWENGIKILEGQLRDKKNGKKYCRTLQLEKLERISEESLNIIKSKEFYDKYISNCLFYGIEEYFYTFNYPKPKSYLEIRTFTLFSFAMLSIHNMIAFYLLSLTSEYIEATKKKNQKITSYYGGNLKIIEKKLKVDTYDLYYFNFYKEFRKKVKSKCKVKENRMILKLDIKNYYQNISIKKMLNEVHNILLSSKASECYFNENTKNKIITFYEYISSISKDDIPVYDNGISSDFIGYLYLFFVEISMRRELLKKYKKLDIEIIRYVDDMFIVIDFQDDVNRDELIETTLKIMSYISNFLYSKYSLHLNSKTRTYDCSIEDEIERLKEDLSMLSNEEIEPLEEANNPQKSLDDIYEELKKIKEKGILYLTSVGSKKDLGNIDLEILKDIYDQRVLGCLKKPEEKERFKNILESFPIKLFKLAPKPLLAILSVLEYEEKIEEIKEYLIAREELNITDLNLILEILGQEEYKDSNLKNKLNNDTYLSKIMKSMNNKVENKLLYLNIEVSNQKLIDTLVNTEQLISQIIKRKFSEKDTNYSLALNHLVNEIQLLMYTLVNKNNVNYEKYTVETLKQDLDALDIEFDLINNIKKIFDLRNLNEISHSISKKIYTQVIGIGEYTDSIQAYRELLCCINDIDLDVTY